MWLAARYGASKRQQRGVGDIENHVPAGDVSLPPIKPAAGGDPFAYQPNQLDLLKQYDEDRAWFAQPGMPRDTQDWAQPRGALGDAGAEGQHAHMNRLRQRRQELEAEADRPIPAEAWVGGPEGPSAEPAAAIADRAALPRRTPGEDLAQNPPPVMRGRDLPQRVPGRDPHEVSYGPRIPSIQDWVQQMRDKGISLNHSLQRPDAARPEDMVRRPGGRDLMKEFTRPLRQEPDVPAPDPVDVRLLQNQKQDTSLERPRIFRRRRTSAVVNSYISDVLHKVSGLDEEMAKQGWDPYRSGGNRGYTQRLDDGDVHVLESQGDGTWIHNHGPSEDEMGDNPTAHDSLAEALIKAHRGTQVQFAAKPPMSKREMN